MIFVIDNNLGANLKERYQNLNKDMETLKLWKKALLDSKEILSSVKSRYSYVQKQQIANLAYIFPITVSQFLNDISIT